VRPNFKKLVLALLVFDLVCTLCIYIIPNLRVRQPEIAKQVVHNFVEIINRYYSDTGQFPTTKQGLDALLVKPDGVSNWHGPYLINEIHVPRSYPKSGMIGAYRTICLPLMRNGSC
jgi:hypothetical protein